MNEVEMDMYVHKVEQIIDLIYADLVRKEVQKGNSLMTFY